MCRRRKSHETLPNDHFKTYRICAQHNKYNNLLRYSRFGPSVPLSARLKKYSIICTTRDGEKECCDPNGLIWCMCGLHIPTVLWRNSELRSAESEYILHICTSINTIITGRQKWAAG